jgi:hypothetical protein
MCDQSLALKANLLMLVRSLSPPKPAGADSPPTNFCRCIIGYHIRLRIFGYYIPKISRSKSGDFWIEISFLGGARVGLGYYG